MRNFYKRLFVVSCLIALKLFPVFAQQDSTLYRSDEQLPEVVVTGTGTAHSAQDAPVHTEVISEKEIKKFNARSVEELLASLSASFSFHGSDMGAGMRLNGLGNDYILVLIDGKRMAKAVGGQTDLGSINLHNIERIEVVRGAASSLYGSEAIAGVINFITKKQTAALQFSNHTRVGCYADVNQRNSFALKGKKWSARTSTMYSHTDGWQNTTREYFRHRYYENSVTRTVSRSDRYKVAQTLSYTPNERWSFSVDGSSYGRWSYRPSGVPQWQLKNYYYAEWVAGTEAKWKPNKNWDVEARVHSDVYRYYYDYIQREYMDFFDENGVRVVYYPGDRVLQNHDTRIFSILRGVYRVPGGKHVLHGGTELDYNRLYAPHRIKGHAAASKTWSLYLQDEWNPCETFNVTAGARLVVHNAFGAMVTPKLSAMYKQGRWSVRASYAMGFKAPEVKELYYSNHATIMNKLKAYYGNDKLVPQTSQYVSCGAEYRSSMLKVHVAPFYNGLRNMIELVPIPTSPEDKLLEVVETMRYTNLSRARTYGVDCTFTFYPAKGWSLGGGYSYLNAKAQYVTDKSMDEAMQDPTKQLQLEWRPINSTAHHRANLRAGWEKKWERYHLGINLYGEGSSMRYYLSDGNTKPYMLWRLATTHLFPSLIKNSKLEMQVGVDNILNYVDRTPFGFNRGTNSPGRTYYVSLNLNFENKKNKAII